MNNIEETPVVLLTDGAVEQLNKIMEDQEVTEKHALRVGVKGGGCSGLMYDIAFDDTVTAQDDVFEDQGVKVIVDRKSLLYLLGTTLEFSDGLNGKGFQFVNPNASRTCGCGESFSI